MNGVNKTPTLIDFFRAFQSFAEKNCYAASVRVLYYSILNAWNEERRPECLRIRRGTLQDLTGLSETAVRRGLQVLSSIGWIKLGKVHSKNAPLAVIMRLPGESQGITITKAIQPEKERVHAKSEEISKPNGPCNNVSRSVLDEARRVLAEVMSRGNTIAGSVGDGKEADIGDDVAGRRSDR